jgi:5-formyltetrahydrofolate cyclo-ligase
MDQKDNKVVDNPEAMASAAALKAAKKELRTLMKKRLSNVSPESISSQSRPLCTTQTHHTN